MKVRILKHFLRSSAMALVALSSQGHATLYQTQPADSVQDGIVDSAPSSVAVDRADPTAADGVGEIIVTAQKRSESINKVGMSIIAASGDTLDKLGITNADQLIKIVPGFNYTPSAYNVPVYALRGIGFFDAGFGTTSPVSIYIDEVPLPYPVLSRGATLDLERVEVLKGPQGTLFGQNSTGGSINYVAAKPTRDWHMGVDMTAGRFKEIVGQAFVSGPLTDTLRIRVAGRREHMGPWQQSYTRDDAIGRTNFTTARVLVEWEPSDRLRANLNFNGFWDRSQNQVGQYYTLRIANPTPALAAYPLPPRNDRATDWDPQRDFARIANFKSVSGRIDYDLTDGLTLTSLTGNQHYWQSSQTDLDGTALSSPEATEAGRLRIFSQELRATWDISDRVNTIIGINYSRFRYDDFLSFDYTQSAFPYKLVDIQVGQLVKTKAVFASGNWQATDQLRLEAGFRYTKQNRNFTGCLRDAGDGQVAAFTVATVQRLFGRTITLAPGSCVTLDPDGNPNLIHNSLGESNTSWRVGANYQATPRVLLYVNASRGYNSGNFPTAGASTYISTLPAKQERLTAYEAGFKASLVDRTLQLNGSAYYYDYRNRQIKGRTLDPFVGVANTLINVPKSRVTGAELQLDWAPVRALRLVSGVSYVNSRILDNFTNVTIDGTTVNFGGEHFHLTPVWQASLDGEYTVDLADDLAGFVGGNVRYQSLSYANPGEIASQRIDGYALADVRFGVRTAQNQLSVTAFIRNVTNKYYWTSVLGVYDTYQRVTGRPRTFGATVSYRY